MNGWFFLALFCIAPAWCARTVDSAQVKTLFKDPPREYSTAPLWVWNDMLTAPPGECEVTRQLKRGVNMIKVVAIGTLKNTLGPHHGNPPLGTAWPRGFRTGLKDGPPPGASYSTAGYGLFEVFVLKHIASK